MRFLKAKFVLLLMVFVTFASSFEAEVMASWNFSSFVAPVTVVENDAFGSAVDVYGEWMVIGSPVRNSRAGVAYVFKKDPATGSFIEDKQLVPGDALVASDNYGYAVAISGDYALVSAYGRAKTIGAVYLFGKNEGGESNWGFMKKIVVPGGVIGDYFGRAVDIDGENIAVSAFANDGGKGAAYVFNKDFGGEGNWGMVKKLVASDRVAGDYMGDSIAISGENVVVGAYRDNSASGSVYLFSKNQGGENNYGQVKRLSASDAASSAYFGYSVDIDGDNIVAGAYRINSQKGAAYVFSRDQGGSANWGQVKKIVASDAGASNAFGISVKLDATKLVVGAVGKNAYAGATYLFERNDGGDGNWGEMFKFAIEGLLAGDRLGSDVAISGGSIVSGAIGSDKVASNGGGVNVYHYNNPPTVSAITLEQAVEDKKLKIAYQLSDLDGNVPSIESFEYSLDEGASWVKMEGEIFSDDAAGSATYDFCAGNAGETKGVRVRARAKDFVDIGEWRAAEMKVIMDCKVPFLTNLKAQQVAGSDDVEFSFDLADDSEVSLVELNVSADGGQNWDIVMTNVSGDLGANVAVGVGKKITWKAGVDLADVDKGAMMFRIKASDKFGNVSEYANSDLFSLDTKAPAVTGSASLNAEPTVNVTLNWEVIEDSNFGFYEIWYGDNAEDVKAHGGTSKVWNKDNDLALASLQSKKTTILGLDYDIKYYFEIWAFDSFGHKSLVSEVSITTPDKPVYTNTVYEEKKIYVYQQSEAEVTVNDEGSVSSALKPATLEVPQSVQVVDGVFRVPEDLQSVTTEVFEIQDDLNNLSLFIPSDAEITLGGKEKFYGDIFKPVIQSGAPLVSQEISNDILLTINADTSADESVYFSKPVIVTFDLDKALNGATLDTKNLIVYFYDKTKEKYDYVSDLAVSLDGKTAAFLTYHFSTFVVMEDSVAASPLVNNEVAFEDTAGHWSQAYVEQLYADGIVNGKGYRKFVPADSITRAEFLKIVLMAFGYDVANAPKGLNYQDVGQDHWAKDFVALADGLGLVQGYGAGIFKPDAEIARAEALKILVVASGLMEDSDGYEDESKFLDVGDEAWYLSYVNYAFEKEVVGGYGNGLFGPSNNLTRAEAAKMVVKMLELKSS